MPRDWFLSVLLAAAAATAEPPLRLHIGCNERDFGAGWVHVDKARFPHVAHHDVKRLPFANESVSLIYASHLFSYFDRDEAAEVLTEWWRVLKRGGTLRLAVPDYEAVARLYVRHADDPSAVEAKGLEPVTLDTFVSMIFGKWRVGAGSQEVIYHRTAYDEASLRTLLLRNGFQDVRRWRWQEVDHGHFDDYSQAYWPHLHKKNGTLVSLNLEATRPGPPDGSVDAAPRGVPSYEWREVGAGPRHVATRYDVEAIRLGARTVEAMGLDRPADEATAAEALQMLRPLRTVARYLLEGDDEEDWHARRFYERLRGGSGAAFEAAYRAIVRRAWEGDAQLSKEAAVVFQALPSLRIQYPGTMAVPYHADGDAGPDGTLPAHPAGERNFLVALTRMRGSASMRIESSEGAADYAPVQLDVGDLLAFDGARCRHGNAINGENYTRVSLDFRLLSVGAYARSRAWERVSKSKPGVATHGPLRLAVGDYYRVLRRGDEDINTAATGAYVLQTRPTIGERERVAVETYLRSDGFLTEHEKTRELEGELVRALPGVSDVVMTTSGSTALELALQALDVDSTTEVIVPDLTMVATANAARRLGARVVFADVDSETWTLTLDRVAPLLTERTRCVVWVALNNRGSARDLRELEAALAARGVALLIDAAQALGAEIGGKPVASYGDLATLSFSSPKIITTGQGGAVVVRAASAHLVAELRRLKNFGRNASGADAYVDARAANFKFTDLQAVVGLAQLADLPRRVARMRSMWARYARLLAPLEARGLARLRGGADAGWVPWFVDLELLGPRPAETRSALRAFLHAHRVGARPMYPQLSAQSAFAEWAAGAASRPHARRGADAVLFLPSASCYDDGVVDLVSELILIFFTSDATVEVSTAGDLRK